MDLDAVFDDPRSGLERAQSSALLGSTPAPGNVFAFTSTGSAAQYPQATYAFPAAIALAVQGRSLDGVVFLLNGSTVVNASNVDRVTVK